MFVVALESLLVFQVLVQLRVLYGIVAEVETFGEVNRSTKPLGKVRIAQVAPTIIRPRVDQLLQVLIVEVGVIAEVFQYVLESDVAIVITVNHEEGLPDGLETLLELNCDLLF